jgi:hypothetical protein
MKRIIKLTESDLTRIVERVISEQKITDFRKSPGETDPYEYGRDGNKYYSRKKGSQNWTLGNYDQQYAIWKYVYDSKTPLPKK